MLDRTHAQRIKIVYEVNSVVAAGKVHKDGVAHSMPTPTAYQQ